MIKAVIFDIDDTLYSHKIEDIPSLSRKALYELKKKGIKIGLCTSREIDEFNSLPKELFEMADAVSSGTGATLYYDGKLIDRYIDEEVVKSYVSYALSHGYAYHHNHDHHMYFAGNITADLREHFESWTAHPMIEESYEGKPVTNFSIYGVNEEEIKEVLAINEGCGYSIFGTTLQLQGKYVTKELGIRDLCDCFGVESDEIVVFGDGNNDVGMLKMAGTAVAVADAKERAKEAADYICEKSIEDGGILEALYDLNVLEQPVYTPRIFFFDIDSTTFDHSIKDVRESTLTAISELKKKGYPCFIATSRSYEELYNVPKPLADLMDGFICLAGADCIFKEKREGRKLPFAEAKSAVEYLIRNNIAFRYVTADGHGYIHQYDDVHEHFFKQLYDMYPPEKKYEGEELLHILYYPKEQTERDAMDQLTVSCIHVHFWRAGEILPIGTDKGLRIIEVAESLGYKREEVCAFGDGNNDVSMMKEAGLGIAMGNGSEECRQAADYVADHISNEGLYKALKHFNVI